MLVLSMLGLSILDVAGAVIVLYNGKHVKVNQYVLCLGLIAFVKSIIKLVS